LEAEQEVALPELQVNVAVPPGATTEGLTANVAAGMRLTVAVASELVPAGPVQTNE
jgi:hypothetical protein